MFVVITNGDYGIVQVKQLGPRERHMPNRNASSLGNDVLRNQRREHASKVTWMTKEVKCHHVPRLMKEFINSSAC